MWWHDEVLETLLEESASTSDRWALLAATLLDTLQEHLFGESVVGEVSASATECTWNAEGQPLTLRLSQHIAPEQNFDISAVNLQLGCSLDDVLPHFRPGQWPLSRALPATLALHPAAEVFRRQMPVACIPAGID